MKYFLVPFFLLLTTAINAQRPTKDEITSWKYQAKQVKIIRDHYGIPHIYGNTDADAVFGLLYAQCEDDFGRVEMNYIDKLGRLSEVIGPSKLYDDLLTRLVIDSAAAVADYHAAPDWLKKLCNAFADGINYFLHTHPDVKPALITRFQPWFPMLWTDGSIGAISTAGLGARDLERFYGKTGEVTKVGDAEINIPEERSTGSNGFAFAPSITASGNAMLYINPHVTFYFRPEVHMVSNEGLNAYGAVTWGQFFIYQGFNEHCGWMHTSSYTDVSDSYEELVTRKKGRYYYKYDGQELPVREKYVKINVKDGEKVSQKSFKTFFTGHGPILGKRDEVWLSVRSDNRNINGLIQSWQRTKAKSFAEYKKTMNLLANASNNTVYADAEGNIAYWHGNFIPKRDPAYDWSKPVDGTTSATEWKGLHSVEESVHLINPSNGWVQNCNSTPFTAAGGNSPARSDFPRYMAPDGENFRGINAVRVLEDTKDYTLDKVIAAGYDTYLAAFELLIPRLLDAYNEVVNDTIKQQLASPMQLLQGWDFRVAEASTATTLAIHWGEKVLPGIQRTKVDAGVENNIVNRTRAFVEHASSEQLLSLLLNTVQELTERFGTWNIAWGYINRFQRISESIDNHFDDNEASYPVAYASATWGMLPSYNSRSFPGTAKRYGVHGNSFVCAVEFGKKIKAKSLLAGGVSGHKSSPHFFDQGQMFASGAFKDVLFYREDVEKHAERKYHPGE